LSGALDSLRQRHTLWTLLDEMAARRGDSEALLAFDDAENEVRLSYAEVAERSRALSDGLLRIGVRRGDRVAILMTNLPEFVDLYFAAARIGAVTVPINTRLAAPEIHYVLHHSQARHLVLLDRFRKLDFLELLADICPDWPASVPGSLFSEALPELRTVTVLTRDGTSYRGPAFDLRELMREPGDSEAAPVSPADLAMIKYTSGSTGFPKGVMLEHGGLVADGFLQSARLQLREDDRWFGCAPLFYVAGSVWGLLSTFTSGGTLVFTETFDPDVTLRLASRERATIVFGVPAVLRDLIAELRTNEYDTSSFRIMGAAVEPSLAKEVRELVPSVETTINCYGMTEMYANIATSSPDDSAELQGLSCGQIYDGIEYRVVDPLTGATLEPGQVGEIQVRGFVMRGYWNDPDVTAQVLDADGWIHSGDLASVDENRYVIYRGRIKAMLKVGGENVSAEEIEQCIAAHAAVQDVVVVPVPDERLDERPLAYVARHPGADVDEDDLLMWCGARLARFKVPVGVIFLEPLPRTGSGKLDRPAVQRLADARREGAGTR
jgi:fatty-acyl-CoA synthase